MTDITVTPTDWFLNYLAYKARMHRMGLPPCSFYEFLTYVGER